jgi:hypothetical protein
MHEFSIGKWTIWCASQDAEDIQSAFEAHGLEIKDVAPKAKKKQPAKSFEAVNSVGDILEIPASMLAPDRVR